MMVVNTNNERPVLIANITNLPLPVSRLFRLIIVN